MDVARARSSSGASSNSNARGSLSVSIGGSDVASSASSTLSRSQRRAARRHAKQHSSDRGSESSSSGAEAATHASQLLWKLAMRMSLHNDNRLFQHFSRSIMHAGPHKHNVQIDQELMARRGSVHLLTETETTSSIDSVATNHCKTHCARSAFADSKAVAPTLPPMPPLVFKPTKRQLRRPRDLSFFYYTHWPLKGLRPGVSVRIMRSEPEAATSSTMECILHVVDLHTKVFWIVKKRFNDIYWLRKKICAQIRSGETTESSELKYLMDLPFPRRSWRNASAESCKRRLRDVEFFLRNLAALEPTTPLRIEIGRELQWSLCTPEFIASLEAIDTSEEPRVPKWLEYFLFRILNSVSTIEGNTCYKFLQSFRNRCAVIEATECPDCGSLPDTSLASEALQELRNVLTKVEAFVTDHLGARYTDKKTWMGEKMDAGKKAWLGEKVDSSSVIEQCVFKAVEDTLVVPLESEVKFLVERTVDTAQEERLTNNIAKMRGRSQSEFGIPPKLQSDDDWGMSCHHMSMIEERPLPCEKIQGLLESALEIFKSCGQKDLEWRETSALTADDYLPIHIYVVVHSGVTRPLLLKEYLGAMIHPSKMKGEIGYFLTMFEVALKYIADM